MTMPAEATESITAKMAEAERKAWDSLSRYKFLMFGYHAATWVNCRCLLAGTGERLPRNPFAALVKLAREKLAREKRDAC